MEVLEMIRSEEADVMLLALVQVMTSWLFQVLVAPAQNLWVVAADRVGAVRARAGSTDACLSTAINI